jgi:hypothetical protein
VGLGRSVWTELILLSWKARKQGEPKKKYGAVKLFRFERKQSFLHVED